ncbi:amino acid adenylation domain-containing protein, partial [Lysobacter maris]
WSRAALTTVLYNRYQQLLSGQALAPVTADWTYRDFVALEQHVQSDPDARTYFATLLEDAPTRQLPRLNENGRASGEFGLAQGIHFVESLESVSADLIALAQRLGVSLQYVLLSIHFKVLAALSGKGRAVSCVTQNGRPESDGAERGLGLYLNSLPLAMDMVEESWQELVARTAELSTRSVAYRRYPVSRIQQDVGSVFDEVTFNYTHFHVYQEMDSSGEPLQVIDSSSFEQTNFDFHVDISRGVGDDTLRMSLVFNADLFDEGLIARIARYYRRAIDLMLDAPQRCHMSTPLLDEQELIELRDRRNLSSVAYDTSPVHRRFEVQVQRTPDAIAVSAGEISLTYAQLDARANRLAGYLRESGIARGTKVGLYMDRSVELMIALIGVLKAGGCYVPMEPSLPASRLETIIADAGIEWVLLDNEGLEKLPLQSIDVMSMDGASVDDDWLAEFEGGSELAEGVGENDLAYVLYTSGSTGAPKGVMVQHRALSNYLDHAAKHYLDEHMLGAVVSSPLSFDATLTTLLPPLLAGKQVELLPNGEALLEVLSQRLFDSGAPRLFKITPAHLEALEHMADGRVGSAAHRIVVGGEQLGVATLRTWKGERLPNARFVNEYGPTETVVGCSVYEMATSAQLEALSGRGAVPIGRPIQNTQLYVLGTGMQIQPDGGLGELYVGGEGVTLGYLNRDGLTAERFVENPFGSGRLYRTGDLVRWLPECELLFEGRGDDQVKVRGFRIELGEIRSVLASVEGVREAAVIARNDVHDGEACLVAYVVAPDADAGLAERCRSELMSRLPEYMWPVAFVGLDALPLTPNGKVDHKALPLPDFAVSLPDYVAPQTQTQVWLADTWAVLLRRDVSTIGIRASFFELGGHSLMAIRLIEMIRRGLGVSVPVHQLFGGQTIEALAAYIDANQRVNRMAIDENEALGEDEAEAVI